MAQTEITAPVSIFDDVGKLCNFGWARGPFFHYDRNLLWTPARSITETERYIIFSPTHLFAFELYDAGIFGHISICAVSLLDKTISSKFEKLPFPMGILELPNQSEDTVIKKVVKGSLMEFICIENGGRIIKIDSPHLTHNNRLRGEVVLIAQEEAQSISTHSQWRRQKERFQLIRCSPCYTVEGVMQFENKPHLFNKGRAWGIYEWIRNVRPKKDIHYWASACGMHKGRQIGFNVGYGSADSSAGTENAFFVNGVLHKLDQVTFKISPSNWLEPWHFTSNNERLEMNFVPIQRNFYQNNFLFYSLRVRQFFGFFSGRVVLDDGVAINFNNITGFAERRKTNN
ncbi:MAG: DUF2804 domain-containing protein [Spirochaetaceae bacterium]|jgi:hypothetical protein|nr:DUF2804 domain-containing protein [Spirochaetaceae bacterium]